MLANVAGLKYPSTRVLLPRTRLAYVHLPNLLNDAKRDRAARVSGYVAIWLPDELLILYLRAGETVNATERTKDVARSLPIADALAKIPSQPEYGEICFHEAAEEQLGYMFAAHCLAPEPWPEGFAVSDPAHLFPYLSAMTFDGCVEIEAQATVNYLVFKHGAVERAFLAVPHHGTLVDRVAKLFARETRMGDASLKRWSGPLTLPVQAPPALVQAYQELTHSLVDRLVGSGVSGAPAVAEQARVNLVAEHPELDGFTFNGRVSKMPVTETEPLTAGVAALVKEIVWATADHEGCPPEQLLKELTWERRHMFQSAGFYDQIPWKLM